MSTTWDIICEKCQERLWIGQGTSSPYVYTDEKTIVTLAKFLVVHKEHSLKFVSEFETNELEGWREFEPLGVCLT
jgi:hypothetical protein